MMKILDRRPMKQWARRTVAPWRRQVAVLLYHRIFEPAADPWELSVSPAHFEKQLAYLKQHYRVMRLADLLDSFKRSRLPRRGVVITFDDGYVDNLINALPLLEKYELPATVFVTSGTIDSGCEFWWDSLERVLLADNPRPDRLRIEVNGREHMWTVGSAKERDQVFWELHPILQALPPPKRDAAMLELLGWAGLDANGRSDYRPMTSAELRTLAQSPLIEIGAHTVTHSSMSDLPAAEQYHEMLGSRRALEELLDRKVVTLAYPYGRYNADSADMAAKAGFEMAFTVETKLVNMKKNPWRLGRFGVEDWGRDEFAYELREVFRT